MESWNELLDHIYGMAKDTPWLREECAMVLVQTIESLPAESNLELYVRGLSERLVSYKLANTPEGIALWLALQARPEPFLPANIWHDNDPLSTKNRPKLIKVLKGDIQDSSENGESDTIKAAATSVNPQFAWNVILSKLLQGDNESKVARTDASKSQFGQLWLSVIDGKLVTLNVVENADPTSTNLRFFFISRAQVLGIQAVCPDDQSSARMVVFGAV